MRRCCSIIVVIAVILFLAPCLCCADDREIGGVTFPGETVVAGKTVTLNGVALLKKFGFVKVYAGGFYSERPIGTAEEAVTSEQIKQFHLHYLTSKATAEKLREGFLELLEENNPKEMIDAHQKEIETYISWYDKDMAPGKTSITTYEPGKGLTLVWQGDVKGTIPGDEFAQMYFRYVFGDKADESIKNGYLGKK